MSIMNAACDLSNAPLARSDAEPRPWGFWASFGWGLFALATAFFAALICMIIWALTHQMQMPTDADVNFNNLVGAIALIAASATLVIAVKWRQQSLRDYFALYGAPRRDLLLGFAALLAIVVVSEIAERLFGIDAGSKVVIAEYREAKLAGALPVLWFTVVIVAPITEELMFRGFLHRGWAASRLGVIGTIVLASALWAALHQQYNAYGLFDVFVTGLVFGWIRQRSGSITPAIVFHALNNLIAMALVTGQVEWLG